MKAATPQRANFAWKQPSLFADFHTDKSWLKACILWMYKVTDRESQGWVCLLRGSACRLTTWSQFIGEVGTLGTYPGQGLMLVRVSWPEFQAQFIDRKRTSLYPLVETMQARELFP